jgi:hypothetical protein
MEVKRAVQLLREVVAIQDAQDIHNPSFANQGQAMDGYSALYNYNSVANKIRQFLADSAEQHSNPPTHKQER